MEAIHTIDRLRYNLNLGPGYNGYSDIIGAVNFDEAELSKICYWRNEGYSRIRVYDTESIEALITCWLPGSKSPIHNYQLQQGWIKVLKGTLELEYYDLSSGRPVLYGNKLIKEGQYVYLNDGMGYHRFINHSKSKVVALHFYCDKIEKWQQYNEGEGTVSEVEVGCDMVLDTPLQ